MMTKFFKYIKKLSKHYCVIPRKELNRLRASEETWRTAIKSLEDHNKNCYWIPK